MVMVIVMVRVELPSSLQQSHVPMAESSQSVAERHYGLGLG
jgi:hypothetical protein